jgi:hypothetical protein
VRFSSELQKRSRVARKKRPRRRPGRLYTEWPCYFVPALYNSRSYRKIYRAIFQHFYYRSVSCVVEFAIPYRLHKFQWISCFGKNWARPRSRHWHTNPVVFGQQLNCTHASDFIYFFAKTLPNLDALVCDVSLPDFASIDQSRLSLSRCCKTRSRCSVVGPRPWTESSAGPWSAVSRFRGENRFWDRTRKLDRTWRISSRSSSEFEYDERVVAFRSSFSGLSTVIKRRGIRVRTIRNYVF